MLAYFVTYVCTQYVVLKYSVLKMNSLKNNIDTHMLNFSTHLTFSK